MKSLPIERRSAGRARSDRQPNAPSGERIAGSAELGLGRRLAAGGQRWNIAGYAALPGLDPLAFFEPRQMAGDDRAGRGQRGEAFAYRRQGHAGLSGNFQIEPLTVFLEAIEDFDHSVSLLIFFGSRSTTGHTEAIRVARPYRTCFRQG